MLMLIAELDLTKLSQMPLG